MESQHCSLSGWRTSLGFAIHEVQLPRALEREKEIHQRKLHQLICRAERTEPAGPSPPSFIPTWCHLMETSCSGHVLHPTLPPEHVDRTQASDGFMIYFVFSKFHILCGLTFLQLNQRITNNKSLTQTFTWNVNGFPQAMSALPVQY